MSQAYLQLLLTSYTRSSHYKLGNANVLYFTTKYESVPNIDSKYNYLVKCQYPSLASRNYIAHKYSKLVKYSTFQHSLL